MSSTGSALSISDKLSTSLPEQPKPSPIERVTGKVRTAIEAMVWEGLPRAKAAEKAGISEHGLYKALRKPPVKAFYMEQLDVLRTSERARNIHALVEVRDGTGNAMARVGAVKVLEQISDEAGSHRSSVTPPGLTIIIENGSSLTQPAPRIINNDDGSST
jgi:hypothetical protein